MPRQESSQKNVHEYNQEIINDNIYLLDLNFENLQNIQGSESCIDLCDFELENLPSLKLTRNNGRIYGKAQDCDYF